MPKDLGHGPGDRRVQTALSRTDHGRRGEEPAEGLQDVGRAGAAFTRAPGGAIRQGSEVRTWYFEVWNEPDIGYWHGTPAEYFKLYDYAVAGVRAALPNAMVGGPASTGPGSAKASAFLEQLLQHCENDKSAWTGEPIPLDFISFHPKGRPALVDGHVRMGICQRAAWRPGGFAHRRAVPRSTTPAHHSERGRSRGLRGLLGEGESGKRLSQRPALSRVHGGCDEGAVRFGGRDRRAI